MLREDLLREANTKLLRTLVLTINQLTTLNPTEGTTLKGLMRSYQRLTSVFSDPDCRQSMCDLFCYDGYGMDCKKFEARFLIKVTMLHVPSTHKSKGR